MKKGGKIILGLIIIAFIIRFIFSLTHPVIGWDEAVYANLGYDLTKNGFDYSLKDSFWSDRITSYENPYAWPNIGFRAPLLPITNAIFYFLNISFSVELFILIIGAISVFLVYILGKKLFNEKVGLISAVFFMLLPLHIINSSHALTGAYSTFFILLAFISFWEGFEKEKKHYKVLFGVFLALAILSRYTALWIIPSFALYFLIRDKSLKILKDKYFWYSITAFLIVISPILIYGQIVYGNVIGTFIHGKIATSYYGGVQSWSFYFKYWIEMFSALGIIFFLSLIYIILRKDFKKKEVMLLLLWFIPFLILAIYMPHKELRFLVPITPTIVLLSGFLIDKIKKHKKILLIAIIIILLASNILMFYKKNAETNTETEKCFLKANKYLKSLEENILIFGDQLIYTYYHTKKEVKFFPNPWSIQNLKLIIETNSAENKTYLLITNFQSPEEYYGKINEDLKNNFEKVFECTENNTYSIVYKSKK